MPHVTAEAPARRELDDPAWEELARAPRGPGPLRVAGASGHAPTGVGGTVFPAVSRLAVLRFRHALAEGVGGVLKVGVHEA